VAQPRPVLGEGREVGVVAVTTVRDDQGARADEAADVVDVSVGVVARDARAEPQDLADAEVARQGALDAAPAEAWVARLQRLEEALFGRDEGAAAVHVDGAAFEHQVAASGARQPTGQTEEGGHDATETAIVPVIRVLRPAIEAPVHERTGRVGVAAHDLRE
jgi:hypothetical protein